MAIERVARSIRFAPEVWTALEAEAARQNRSVNNLLETIARASTADAGAPRGKGKSK